MIRFDNTFARLPERFSAKQKAAIFPNPKLIQWNEDLALELGISRVGKSDDDLAQIFSGQSLIESSDPIATTYAGHQFAHFNPQLGDGRALLLGEMLSPTGQRFDIQLKGSGETPFSRRGDGKSAMGPVIREYIVSEAMFHLEVPTTRALAAVSTGENVYRESEMPGAVLTRVAASHIRIGHFEYFASRGDVEGLEILTKHAVHRHYPEIENDGDYIFLFFQKVMQRQAVLIAQWMDIGFIHGVMNTDNMLISGDTIDYGPCAFMDIFNYEQVYSSIDRNGRYAYKNQPQIAQWNLSRLAECLLLLTDAQSPEVIKVFEKALDDFSNIYQNEWTRRMGNKLGLSSKPLKEEPGNVEIISLWLDYLQAEKLDYTNSFRKLGEHLTSEISLFSESEKFKSFKTKWKSRLKIGSIKNHDTQRIKSQMDKSNPIYIPRNHQVERAIQGAITGDYSVFREMIQVMKKPFEEQAGFEKYKLPPKPDEVIKNTFCGT